MYSGYEITFDSGGSSSFGNGTVRNIIILVLIVVHHHMLKIAKNNFLIIGLGPTYGINGKFGSAEKKCSINFTKSNTKLCLSLHYNDDNICLFVNGKELNLKLTMKMLTF